MLLTIHVFFWGKAFPLGSPLVPDISREILNLTEGENMRAIENKWFPGEKYCLDRNTTDTPIQLDHHSFQALFMIVFGTSLVLLFIMLSCRRYLEGRGDMNGDPSNNPDDDHLLLFLLMLASRRYQQRRGNIIGAQPNHPGNGPDGKDNARANQNRDVNEGGPGANETGRAAEPADNDHCIVEVNVGDGHHEANRIGKVNLELQRQQSQACLVRRRSNKLFSEKNMPLGMAAPPPRMHLA